MAVGSVQQSRTVPGNSFTERNLFTGDTSYPSGGYQLNASTFGFSSHIRRVFYPQPANIASATGGSAVTIPTYGSGGIISSVALVFLTAAGAQVANGTDVSALSYYVTAEGV